MRLKIASYIVIGLMLGGLSNSCKHEPVKPLENGNNGGGNGGGGSSSTKPCDTDTAYFVNNILPILTSNCAKSGCHDAATAQDGVILDNYTNVMSSGIIDPFDLSGSDLYEAITETDPDKIMPPPPASNLSPEQISLIATWINQGALNNYCDGCDSVNVTYSGIIEPIINNYCRGCHSGASPNGNVNLENYFDVSSIALNGYLLGVINASTGYVPMPYNSNPLLDCQIDQITNWVNQGAPNN